MFATNGTSFFVQAKYDGWREAVVTDVCFWHKADIRGTATFCPLLEQQRTIATGLGAMGLLGWGRKRKAIAARSKPLIGFRRGRREAVFLCVPSMIDSWREIGLVMIDPG